MNFEFPLTELPAVMRGPRVERRRVLVGGSAEPPRVSWRPVGLSQAATVVA